MNKSIVLAVITVVSALLISGFEFLLFEKRAVTKQNEELKIQKKFFPDALSFEKIEDDFILAKNSKKKTIGYIYFAEDSNGYGGNIRFMVAVDINWKIIDFIMLDGHSETPGLGSQANDDWFRKAFKGVKALSKELPASKKDFQKKLKIDAISGATITSMATVHAIGKTGDNYQGWHKNVLRQKFIKTHAIYFEEIN
ncbi:MAG: hypothetical protein A2Y41_02890 [Spirochaetes bacterium GWB1_36_13]|nr:MAG: hypothetical protein A2Y41_02890 [Spirochaetes bacterium GWB1_36_13]